MNTHNLSILLFAGIRYTCFKPEMYTHIRPTASVPVTRTQTDVNEVSLIRPHQEPLPAFTTYRALPTISVMPQRIAGSLRH